MATARQRPEGQDGLTIVLALFFLIVATVVAAVSYKKIHEEGSGTARNANVTKARMLAESGMYLGMAIARGDFPYTCVTHAPNGIDKATGPDACSPAKLPQLGRLYSNPLKLNASTGWLEEAAANAGESLTGASGEKVSIKIWNPTDDTVRVVGRAVYDGVTEDAQLFGSWGGS